MKTYTFQEAEASFRSHPYFILPAISALSEATPEERTILMRRIAAAVGDEATLRTLLGIDPEEFARFYPDMLPPELTTDDTITSFISRFSSEQEAEAPEIEEIVAAPAIDYASQILADEEAPLEMESDATSDAIADFLAVVPAKTPKGRKVATTAPEGTPEASVVAPVTSPVKPADAPQASTEQMAAPKKDKKEEDYGGDLSEALLKMMIKNKNYPKALEIITELNLNNPKKSVYFADQMRFLKKLIQAQQQMQCGK